MYVVPRTTLPWIRRAGTAIVATALAALLVVATPAVAGAQAVSASSSLPVVAALPQAASASLVQSASASVSSTFDQQMIQLVNSARAGAGVGKVTEARGLSQLSVWWSTQLQDGATGYNLAHNPNAWTMVTGYGASNRTAWAENVGWSSSLGTTAAQLFNAYMQSPGHKANIMSANYHYIGMGTVGGTHGLFNTTEFTDAVQSGQAVVPPTGVSYAFVVDASTHAVYRMVGGAPVYVSSFAPFVGRKVVTPMTHAQILAMPRFPANGTFVRTLGNGAIYRMAGGAPLYVASWAPFGGPKPWVEIDPAAVANAGQAGVWAHLTMYPANNTLIQGAGSAPIYRVVNGVATHLLSWSQVGGPKPFTVVHPNDISRAGTGGVYNHLRK